MTKDNLSHLSRRSALSLLSGAAVGVAGFSNIAAAEEETDTDRARNRFEPDEPEEWILRLTDPATVSPTADEIQSVSETKETVESQQQAVVNTLATMSGVSIKKQFWLANAILVDADDLDDDPVETFGSISGVEDVHPNFTVETPTPVDEQKLTTQDAGQETTYGLAQVSAPDVWQGLGTRGDGASVAVLDTGVDPEHPDIELAADGWIEFTPEGEVADTDPSDQDGHGTHVSGTVTGGAESGVHIGVAPDADLYHARVFSEPGGGATFAQVVAGMQWAVESNTDVINMSLGASGFFADYIEPVQAAKDHGTLVISSSGNDGPDTSGSPANVYDSVAIGATTDQETVAGFSSGEQVYTPDSWEEPPEQWPTWYSVPNVSSPGEDVLSAATGGGYTLLSGTSMAAPHAAGIAALMKSADSSLTPHQIEQLLEDESVHPAGSPTPDTRFGVGITDAFRTVTAIEHDAAIDGTVTDGEGEPAEGVLVETDYGTTDVTDTEGEYYIPVPEGDTTVQAVEFGKISDPQTVSVTTDETVDLELADTLSVELLSGQPIDAAVDESFTLEVSVANLETLTIEVADESESVSDSDVTFSLGDDTVDPGEPISLDDPVSDDVELTVTLGDEIEDEATLVLAHTFEGLSETETVSTGPTTLRVDPEPAAFEITDPNFQETVGEDSTLVFSPTITNTGELADTQPVVMSIDFAGVEADFPAEVTIEGGESETIQRPVSFGDFPREEGVQTIATADDSAEGTFFYEDVALELVSTSAEETHTAGEPLEVTATVENAGELTRESPVEFSFFETSIASRNLEVSVGETEDVTFTVDTRGLPPETYEYVLHAVETEDSDLTATMAGTVTLEEPSGPPAIVGDAVPQDLNGDGLYEDITGDGEFSILDVQALFNNLDNPAVQENAQYFDFSGVDPDEVTIIDVQSLYSML